MAIVKGEKRRRPGTWIADFRNGAGERIVRSFETKRAAEDFHDQERPRARLQAARSKVPARISVKDYAEQFWLPVAVDARPKLKPATKFHYRRVMEKFWIPVVGHASSASCSAGRSARSWWPSCRPGRRIRSRSTWRC